MRRLSIVLVLSLILSSLVILPAAAAAPSIRRGSNGEAVLEVQRMLKSHGFDPGPLDGVFGPCTEDAVIRFQKANGLDADGVVGPQTGQALRSEPGTSRARMLLTGKTIAIDPGHGGANSGAVGLLGTREADHTLAIALNLEGMLKSLGARVVMTRRTDTELTPSWSADSEELGARVAVANNAGASLFVSIHNNAYEKDPSVSGVMTFHNGQWSSTRLASSLLDGVSRRSGLAKVGVEYGNFYVLRNSWMPSTLVEVGFMTNAADEKALCSPQFRKSVASGLLDGIVDYLGGR